MRIALIVLVIGVCVGFVGFVASGIVAHDETEEEDQLAIPPMRPPGEIAFVNGLNACVSPSPAPQSCGVERWSVKTGTDASIASVNLNSATPTTVTLLHALPSPSPIPANSRVAPGETTQWVINGTLVEYKLESDSDYHIVVQDGSGNTIVTEIPYPGATPACVPTSSVLLAGIAGARCKFDGSGLTLPTTSFRTVNIPVRVVGVGMFDFAHGQTGASPNQIEIHAILDIAFPKTTNAPTSMGSNVNVQLGDSSLTFNTVTAAGTTTSVPIDPSTSGTAPVGSTLIGPAFNLTSTASLAGPTDICISVPYITDETAFSKLNILDLEGGILVNRTTSVNSGPKTVCATLPSLARVVVALGTTATGTPTPTPTPSPTPTPTVTPTPSPTPFQNVVTVSGKALTSDMRGLRNATVTMTDSNNVVRTATTSSFGFFSFDNVVIGQQYTFRVQSRLYRYSPVVVTVNDTMTLPDFVGAE